ncbi:hypothetical protein [Streptomyces sp. JH14]|nr:hypothetical protein [Streptomyces sp. JH14]
MAWAFIGGHVVENDVDAGGTAAFLVLFVLLGSLLALPRMPG